MNSNITHITLICDDCRDKYSTATIATLTIAEKQA